MRVDVSHHIDASAPDAEGFYDYHYEYDIYRFSEGGKAYVVRSYIEEGDRAAIVSCLDGETSRLLGPADLTDPLLIEAVAYLRGVGKTTLDWLTADGYVPLEPRAAPTRE
ncbi:MULTISPECIES: hypothetical protein [unclassified Ensifer]|uniref:hypothetical protein n=1 Tax=unclassified Ensifer TaxID=2633371 RepID=UPI000813BAB0|nr:MULTISPECIES: hypothetical protein [unclassified Ensifer]OCP16105.1 hypothetical protein BC363_10800 [Ensifer sp. LC384]OCP35622.1 hypothetical protein BC360_08980 [Ensifer sp. LC163]